MESSSISVERIAECLEAEASVGFSWRLTAELGARHEACVAEAKAVLQMSSYAQAVTREEVNIRGSDPGAAALSITSADDDAFYVWADTIQAQPTLPSFEVWPLSELISEVMLHPNQTSLLTPERMYFLRHNIHLAVSVYLDKHNPDVVCKGFCPEEEVAYLDELLNCRCEPVYQQKVRRLVTVSLLNDLILQWEPDSGVSPVGVSPDTHCRANHLPFTRVETFLLQLGRSRLTFEAPRILLSLRVILYTMEGSLSTI